MINGIKKYMQKHNLFNKVAKNSGLLMFQNIYTMLLGVFITGIIARYFGTEEYGIFNYVLSITGLFAGIATIRYKLYCSKRLNSTTRKRRKDNGYKFLDKTNNIYNIISCI